MSVNEHDLDYKELKDEELGSVSGGAGANTTWVCPVCNWTQEASGPYVPCPKCKEQGKKTLMVKA